MKLRTPTRLAATAALVLSATAGLVATTASAANAASEPTSCTTRFADHPGTINANAFNFRSGPSSNYLSKGYLYKTDKIRLKCARGDWYYGTLTARSKSGLPKNTNGWLHRKFLLHLA
ncbi:SH3 domain-containing protein [Streptomyces sp. NPDC001948]